MFGQISLLVSPDHPNGTVADGVSDGRIISRELSIVKAAESTMIKVAGEAWIWNSVYKSTTKNTNLSTAICRFPAVLRTPDISLLLLQNNNRTE